MCVLVCVYARYSPEFFLGANSQPLFSCCALQVERKTWLVSQTSCLQETVIKLPLSSGISTAWQGRQQVCYRRKCIIAGQHIWSVWWNREAMLGGGRDNALHSDLVAKAHILHIPAFRAHFLKLVSTYIVVFIVKKLSILLLFWKDFRFSIEFILFLTSDRD